MVSLRPVSRHKHLSMRLLYKYLALVAFACPLFFSCNFVGNTSEEVSDGLSDVEVYPCPPAEDTTLVYLRDSVYLAQRNAAMIVVDKAKMMLSVLSFRSDTLLSVPITAGREFGTKQTDADDRTPEGVFRVRSIENSSQWPHTLADGVSVEYDAYGPFFIRLDYPPGHRIGIHGTKHPHEIGRRTSEGCVRVRNEDIRRVVRLSYIGMPVVILPSAEDVAANAAYSASLSAE